MSDSICHTVFSINLGDGPGNWDIGPSVQCSSRVLRFVQRRFYISIMMLFASED